LKNRVLVTGGTGLLGKAVMESAPKDVVLGFTFSRDFPSNYFSSNQSYKVQLEEPETFLEAIKKFEPSLIIHCAAMGSVDEAEAHPEKAKKINVDILKPLIEISNERDITFQLVSTNAVYDGENPPYSEESFRSSVNYYGYLKILAEDLLQKECKNYIIIRPILMYGIPLEGRRENPFSWIYKTLKNEKEIRLVDDVFTMPLLDSDCARVCWESRHFTGESFNVAGNERLTLYHFALKIAEKFNFRKDLIIPVPSDYFSTIAKRPRDTCFNISKIQDRLKIFPRDIESGLTEIKRRLNG
jgi:dTDP-4-dehydrorhamnose reductase